MVTTTPKDVTVQKIDTAICNRCGADLLNGSEGWKDVYGLSGDVTGGYFSTSLMDMTRYKFDLCESCLCWLFTTFKHPVEVWEMSGSQETKLPDEYLQKELERIQTFRDK